MDTIDRKILEVLQDNGRISNIDLAKIIGMTPSGMLERVRKLSQSGVIQGFGASINPTLVGLHLTAFVDVQSTGPIGIYDIGAALAKFPEVLESHLIAGAHSYMLKVRIADTEDLTKFLHKVSSVEGVSSTNTTIVLNTYKETSKMPLDRIRMKGGKVLKNGKEKV